MPFFNLMYYVHRWSQGIHQLEGFLQDILYNGIMQGTTRNYLVVLSGICLIARGPRKMLQLILYQKADPCSSCKLKWEILVNSAMGIKDSDICITKEPDRVVVYSDGISHDSVHETGTDNHNMTESYEYINETTEHHSSEESTKEYEVKEL